MSFTRRKMPPGKKMRPQDKEEWERRDREAAAELAKHQAEEAARLRALRMPRAGQVGPSLTQAAASQPTVPIVLSDDSLHDSPTASTCLRARRENGRVVFGPIHRAMYDPLAYEWRIGYYLAAGPRATDFAYHTISIGRMAGINAEVEVVPQLLEGVAQTILLRVSSESLAALIHLDPAIAMVLQSMDA